MIRIHRLDPVDGYIVSERLKVAIEEAGCTGVEMESIETHKFMREKR